MKTISLIAIAIAVTLSPSRAIAHGGAHLHVNPKWKECSIQLDPSLTQNEWRQFTQEAGLVTYFRPLATAKPLGAWNFEFSILQWETGINGSDGAWNNTFVHPDSTHWLTEGGGLKFPGLTFRAGLTDRIDAGVYVTKSPGANYGFYGGQLQYNFVHDVQKNWAASARMSFVSMYGPKDVDFTVYGVDLVASRDYTVLRKWATLSPYAGISTYLASSHEKTNAVDLRDEHVAGVQGMIGVAAQISHARLAVEYNVARVHSFSLKMGASF